MPLIPSPGILEPPVTGGPRFDHAWRGPSWRELTSRHPNWAEVRDTYPTWEQLRWSGVMPLPDGNLDSFYLIRLRVTGGTPPYRFAVLGGHIPAGLDLDPDAGLLSGTPEGDAQIQTIFSVRVTDSTGKSMAGPFLLQINAPVRILPPPPEIPPPLPDLLWLEPASTDPGSVKLVLTDPNGRPGPGTLELVHWSEVDYGYPEVREVAEDRVQASGTIDRTKFSGARVVQLTGKVAIDWQAMSGIPRARQQAMDALAPYLTPGARTWLYSRFDDGQVRRMLVRADQFSRPQIANVQDISVSFKSPTGVLEDWNESRVRLIPFAEAGGVTFPLTFNHRFPPGGGSAWLANNLGNVPADWTVRIFGPCRNPVIVNVDTGERIAVSMEIDPGDFLEISTRDHAAVLNGTDSVWHLIDYEHTTWWPLEPGRTRIRLECEWWDTPAVAWIYWRHSNLL